MIGADNHENQFSQSDKGHFSELSAALEYLLHIRHKSFHPYMIHSYPPMKLSSKTFGESQPHSQTARKCIISNLLKAAPDPVKLPSTGCVISQSSIKSSQLRSSSEPGAAGPQLEKAFHDPTDFDCSVSLLKPIQDKIKIENSNSASSPSQKDD